MELHTFLIRQGATDEREFNTSPKDIWGDNQFMSREFPDFRGMSGFTMATWCSKTFLENAFCSDTNIFAAICKHHIAAVKTLFSEITFHTYK